MSNKQPQKNIVILSPEPWGKMLISKMHYALELVKMGNKVFFVNPTRQLDNGKLVSVAEEREGGQLVIIDTAIIPGTLFFRHKLLFLYPWLINNRYIRAIKKITGPDIDQVWNFNPNVYTDLSGFGAKRSILLLYDFYKGAHVFKAAEKAEAIISVSQVILDHYEQSPPPKLLLQHGLGEHFADKAIAHQQKIELEPVRKERIRIGYTGNLLRAGMNTSIARQIIEKHADKEFHFWGPYSMNDNNVSAVDGNIPPELLQFVDFLKSQQHVFLHGVVQQKELAASLADMDAFLFLYSPRTEMNGASNSHKLLEYISTGKTVVSTYVSNYAGTDLLIMSGKDEEEKLPELFDRVTGDLTTFNSREKQESRINFALSNTYTRQVGRILKFVQG